MAKKKAPHGSGKDPWNPGVPSKKKKRRGRKPNARSTSFRLQASHLKKLDAIAAKLSQPYSRTSRGDALRMVIDQWQIEGS